MMRVAMLASASAIAFIFAVGSVSAADQFSTLEGVKAVPMSSSELSAVKGMDHHFFLQTPTDTPNTIVVNVGSMMTPNLQPVLDPAVDAPDGHPLETDGRFGTVQHQDDTGEGNFIPLFGNPSVAPSYLGLSQACAANNVILLPGFVPC